MRSICSFCNHEEQVIQLCCPTGQKCCNDCFLNGNISNDKICSCCQRPLGKKAKKIIRDLMEYNSQKYLSECQGVQDSRQNTSMANTNMYIAERRNNYGGGKNGQQMGFNKTTFQGNYQNHQYSPHPGFMSQSFPAPFQMMGYPPPNFPNWQPGYCYGQMPNMQPMMPVQQHRNGNWVNPYDSQQNYNYQNYYRSPQYQSQSDQQFIERTKRSADKGLPHYVPESLLESSREYEGKANFRGYQQHLNKTTDLIEQTTNNKVVRMNRSSSVNNLTVRR